MGSLHTPAMTAPASNPNAGYLARRATDAFATQLSAGITNADATIPLVSVAGLSTDTAVTLIIEPGTANQETIIGWVESNNIVNCARHVEGATIAHVLNAVVMCYQTAIDHNSLVDFLLESHNPDGTLNAAAVAAAVTIPAGTPSGAIMQYAGISAPSGWLIADGSSVLRATYPNLFTAISTTYGTADGTHFNVPDLRGRVAVGKNGATFSSLGATGGAESVSLAHAHTVASHSHGSTLTASGGDNQNHTHNGGNGTGNPTDGFNSVHTHNYNDRSGAASPATDSQLSTTGILPPYLTVNHIIKT